MSRHVLATLGLGLLVSLTILLLADAGVFEPAARWLFAHYESEALVRPGETARLVWVPVLAVLVAAFGIGWVTSDSGAIGAKAVVFGVATLLWGFLSLTLTQYHTLFEPFSAMTASALAFATGLCVAETPAGRRRRELAGWLAARVSAQTMEEFLKSATLIETTGEIRELAALSCRVLDPAPAGEKARAYLAAARPLWQEAAEFLRNRPGAVLDLPVADGVRVFFGLLPGRTGATHDAAAAALELKRYLREFNVLNQQAGRPVLTFGIGIATGPMLIGLHGQRETPLLTASGVAADQSRQFAALNARHGTTILLGRRASQIARDQFDLRAVDGDSVQALIGRQEVIADEPTGIYEADETAAVAKWPADEIVLPEPPVDPFPSGGEVPAPDIPKLPRKKVRPGGSSAP